MPTYAAGSPTHQEEFRSRAGEQDEGQGEGDEERKERVGAESSRADRVKQYFIQMTLNKNIAHTSAKSRL